MGKQCEKATIKTLKLAWNLMLDKVITVFVIFVNISIVSLTRYLLTHSTQLKFVFLYNFPAIVRQQRGSQFKHIAFDQRNDELIDS